MSLLQLSTRDLPFREIAFAALCIASGSRNMVVLPADEHKPKRKFNDLHALADPIPEESDDERSLPGVPESPGFSPEEVIYWLEDALIVLATQLYGPQVVEERVTFIARYCQMHRPRDTIDAVLISIEHVILLHIDPQKMIQRTALLPLFDIPNHLCMDVRDRYSGSYLDELGGYQLKRNERRNA